MPLSKSVDDIGKVKLYEDLYGNQISKTNGFQFNLKKRKSTASINKANLKLTTKPDKLKDRHINRRYSEQITELDPLLTKWKDRAKEIYDRLMGPKANNHQDLEDQIKNLMTMRREDRVGELEFERKIKEIKLEAIQRDIKAKLQNNEDNKEIFNQSLDHNGEVKLKPMSKNKIVPTTVIILDSKQNNQLISAESNDNKPAVNHENLSVNNLMKNDQDMNKSEDDINNDSCLLHTKRRGRAIRNLKIQTNDEDKSFSTDLLMNKDSTPDTCKLIRDELNNQIKRRHKLEIEWKKSLKAKQKLKQEEHISRLIKPEVIEYKQISHRKFDYSQTFCLIIFLKGRNNGCFNYF